MTVLLQILERLGLTLNETKTEIVNAYEGKFDFLGFSIWMAKRISSYNHYPHVQPLKKSLRAIEDRVTELTRRQRTVIPLEYVVNDLNASVRGWVGYFHFKNCSKALKHVRVHVEERMQTHLFKRHKIKDKGTGYARFNSRLLYGKNRLIRCR